MKNYYLLFLSVVLFFIGASQLHADDKALVVYLNDGSRVQYLLSDVDSVMFEKYRPEPTYHNGFEYVDLNLSVKWATCNVGAAEPQQAGYYIAWADTIGYTDYRIDEKQFSMNNYVYSKGTDRSLSKYCNLPAYGYVVNEETGEKFVDDLVTLLPEDDAALRYMGEGWSTPTRSQMIELKNNCYWQWTDDYKGTGIPGYIVFKVKDEQDKQLFSFKGQPKATYDIDDVHIFLPMAGYRRGAGGSDTSNFNAAGVWSLGTSGNYWTADIDKGTPSNANMLNLKTNNITVNATGGDRCYGRCIRAVYSE